MTLHFLWSLRGFLPPPDHGAEDWWSPFKIGQFGSVCDPPDTKKKTPLQDFTACHVVYLFSSKNIELLMQRDIGLLISWNIFGRPSS